MRVLFNKKYKKFISYSNSFEIKKQQERSFSQKNIFVNKENLEKKYIIPIIYKDSSIKHKSPVKKIIIKNQLIYSQNEKNENLFPDIEKLQNDKNFEKTNFLRKFKKKNNTYIFKKDIFLKMRSGKSINLLNKSDSKISFHLTKYPLLEINKDNNISNNINKSKNNIIDKDKNNLYNTLLKINNNYNTIDNSTLAKYNNNINNNIFLKKINKENIIKQYCLYSKAGKNEKNQRKINQDYYLILTKLNNNPNFNIFSVLDGHGTNGHLVSKHISKYLKKRFENEAKLKNINETEEIYKIIKENNFKLIKDYFNEAEKDLKKVQFDCNFSGTTCILLIQINYHIICANVGDSRAILINEKKIKKNKDIILNIKNYNNFNLNNKILEIIQLSKDNKPNNPNEKNRILNFGGKIEQININGIKKGPYRVWINNKNYPGLAMSRSIGDLIATNIGVIPLPEIYEINISENSKFILICSDGVWEILNNNNVVDICKKFYFNDNIEQLCFELINVSEEMWKKNKFIVDDITVLCIFF